MTLADVTTFFGWMTAVNIAIYLLAVLAIVGARGPMAAMHERLLGVPRADWPRIYVDYLARYKIAIVMLNLVPWLALLMLG
ncbi:hypothetical protein DKT77_07355 [Meridianimarinicoccus roseus]|jgi:hypothetical protein|uniref:DUF6868 domain-containing protein n=1 Tax=Meridianimarinicoccus roseus TaxID=2072018 RepID=A0A2V2LD24_9RHOB|nr:hypothetical protein [Meridianimarinicoccus roseus]PWR03275.1 hypothetical protein DKT77_07355 [Meridianimarinicoccus roseus]